MSDLQALQIERVDIFAGHLGHLTSTQAEAFATFKDNLARANLYMPSTGISKASHDEPTLLCVSCFLNMVPCPQLWMHPKGGFCVPGGSILPRPRNSSQTQKIGQCMCCSVAQLLMILYKAEATRCRQSVCHVWPYGVWGLSKILPTVDWQKRQGTNWRKTSPFLDLSWP